MPLGRTWLAMWAGVCLVYAVMIALLPAEVTTANSALLSAFVPSWLVATTWASVGLAVGWCAWRYGPCHRRRGVACVLGIAATWSLALVGTGLVTAVQGEGALGLVPNWTAAITWAGVAANSALLLVVPTSAHAWWIAPRGQRAKS